MKNSLEQLEKALGYSFRKKDLLFMALTHPSYAFENNLPSNERLEFLGDAVLSLIVAEKLYQRCPLASEGRLSQRRAEFVQKATLTEISQRLGLGRFLLLGKGEKKQGGERTPSNLANALEAVIGAIYLDGGIRPTRSFIQRHFFKKSK